jgi:hypothetical protein
VEVGVKIDLSKGVLEMKKKLLKFVFIVLLCCGGLTQAVPITIQISGNITVVAGTGRGSVPNTIHAGSTFTGTYTYDSLASDSDSSVQRGVYQYNSPYGISINLGGYEFKTAPNHTDGFKIWIRNDELTYSSLPMDRYTVGSSEIVSTLPAGFETLGIGWYLTDTTHTALSSDALPTTAPVLTDWNYNSFDISCVDSLGRTIDIVGTVTPEPLTGVLLAMGAFFLRRKR